MGLSAGGTYIYTGAQIASKITLTQPASDNALTISKDGLGAGVGLIVTNAGTGSAISIAQNGTGEGLLITNASTSNSVLIDQNGAVDGALKIDNTGNTRQALQITTNNGATQAQPLIQITNDNTAMDEPLIRIQHDGSNTGIDFGLGAGNGQGIVFTNAGTAPDIILSPRATGSIAAAAEGSLAYDSTLHKLKVRGAAGWETVTSA